MTYKTKLAYRWIVLAMVLCTIAGCFALAVCP